MAVKSFDEGAFSPLLSFWRPAWMLASTLLLIACSHKASPPPFIASGYAADEGAVRLWRKDSNDGAIHLLSVFSPWRNGVTTTQEYRWQGDKLALIDFNTWGKSPENIRIRFDKRGELSFMQRERDGQKQQLSGDEITFYRYHAERARATSNALRAGNVILRQGRWNKDQTITTCEGDVIRAGLDGMALQRIAERQRRSSFAVSVAWLEAPEGAQLLLVANSDFCHWQPREKTF